MTTRHKLLTSIVHEYVKNDDLDGLVDEFLAYFPDIEKDDLLIWFNDLNSFEE